MWITRNRMELIQWTNFDECRQAMPPNLNWRSGAVGTMNLLNSFGVIYVIWYSIKMEYAFSIFHRKLTSRASTFLWSLSSFVWTLTVFTVAIRRIRELRLEWNDAQFTLYSLSMKGTMTDRIQRWTFPFVRAAHPTSSVAANCVAFVIRWQHVLDTRLSGKSVYFYPFRRNLAMCCIALILCLQSVNWRSAWYATDTLSAMQFMQFAHLPLQIVTVDRIGR